MKVRFRIDGLNCASCASKIEYAIQCTEGIESASLNFTKMTLTVESDMTQDMILSLIQPIADRIEPGTVFRSEEEEDTDGTDRWDIVRTSVCAVAFVVTFLLEMFGDVDHGMLSIAFLVIFVLAGADTIVAALRNISRGNVFGEEFLMSVATIGAVIIGQYAEAAAVMVFFSVGELIEGYAVGSSRRRISALLDMAPKIAHVEKDGNSYDMSPDSVMVDDIIIVRPGERVPLDGTVIEGSTELDTSALTGESTPLHVSPDAHILSGSVNTVGTIRVRVTDRYEDSTLSRIMELMDSAGDRKAQSERFITRFARYYTPIVCVLALLVAVVPISMGLDADEWVYKALTFLVLSCPCALVISVPMTIMSGIGCASSNGILIKGGNFLEMLSHVDTMAFDKTGTLTNGRFSVVDVVSDDVDTLAHTIYALESGSNHPIAKAICEHFAHSDMMASDIREIPGHGVEGTVSGERAVAGNAAFVKGMGFDVSDPEGCTSVHVTLGDRYLGHVDLMDIPKDGASSMVSSLKGLGVRRTFMLTGDKSSVAERISDELGIDHHIADMLPQDKLSAIEDIISGSQGTTVFVGDGINDGPSLRRADIGISMGQVGSDTAMEASDIIIAGGDLSKIPLAMRISRRTMRILKQNIVLSLGMKVTVLILTLVGLSEMWGAVIADVGACILAIMNSLRALRS